MPAAEKGARNPPRIGCAGSARGNTRSTVAAEPAAGTTAREVSAPQIAGSGASYCPAESGFARATGSAEI